MLCDPAGCGAGRAAGLGGAAAAAADDISATAAAAAAAAAAADHLPPAAAAAAGVPHMLECAPRQSVCNVSAPVVYAFRIGHEVSDTL